MKYCRQTIQDCKSAFVDSCCKVMCELAFRFYVDGLDPLSQEFLWSAVSFLSVTVTPLGTAAEAFSFVVRSSQKASC
jgi:hypothetical protein